MRVSVSDSLLYHSTNKVNKWSKMKFIDMEPGLSNVMSHLLMVYEMTKI